MNAAYQSSEVLTGQVRHGLELFLPEGTDVDRLVLHFLSVCGHPLFVGVEDDLGEVLWHLGVHDVKKVLARRTFAFRIHGGEVSEKLGVLLDLGPQILDGKLVVVGHGDEPHLRLGEQVLVFAEHRLQEVFVDDVVGREIKLDYRGVRQREAKHLRC